MPSSFKSQMEKDFDNMMSVDEFAVDCYNARTAKTFGVIKTDVFISVDNEGMPLVSNTPIINLPLKYDIKQKDILTIESINFNVYEVQQDGIGGQDVYLKYA